MTRTATGTFDITSWDELDKDDKDGTIIARVRLTKAFHGDLTGTSTTEILTVATPAGPVAYVGIEYVEGSLAGRKGTFVLRHAAGSEDGKPWMTWHIVNTSGTGELAGLRGEGRIDILEDGTHSFRLDYEVD